MTGQIPQPAFLDTTVVSNFASTDGLSLLAGTVETPTVVPAVRSEVRRGVDAGYDYLDSALSVVGDEITVREPPRGELHSTLRDRLDRGEAASIDAAIEYEGSVATDDSRARRIATDRSVPVTGSVGLLARAVDHDRLDVATADEWLERWRVTRGYYAPVESVGDLLDD